MRLNTQYTIVHLLISLWRALNSAMSLGSEPFTHVYTTSMGSSGHMLEEQQTKPSDKCLQYCCISNSQFLIGSATNVVPIHSKPCSITLLAPLQEDLQRQWQGDDWCTVIPEIIQTMQSIIISLFLSVLHVLKIMYCSTAVWNLWHQKSYSLAQSQSFFYLCPNSNPDFWRHMFQLMPSAAHLSALHWNVVCFK